MIKRELQALVLLTSTVALAIGTCNIGFGAYPQTGSLLHTLYAQKGPVSEPQNMSLVFDYQVSPVERVEITSVSMNTSLTDGCTFSHPATQNISEGFSIKVSSLSPVLEMSGTATVYGKRYGDFQVHTLYATSGPVPEAQNMSLIFDYQVSPVDTLQVTHVSLSTSLQSGCETSFPTTAITNGFRITVTTQQPVTSFYGTATVFGIRRG
ncbi:uncharacterized protein LOC134205923 isoform X1 [Armigeres subalbatus]|uniref:uncharacterized protein LOC134205923 isoform X1 n=1 Tax=Armigeres subalbatus TaxID=124917 RepID=UPI002ED321D9